MTLESKVICVRELPAGEPIGYGAKFITDKPMRIGVVAMGYADGYVVPVPDGNKEAYRALSQKASEVFRDYGALRHEIDQAFAKAA